MKMIRKIRWQLGILTKEHPTYIKAAALFCDDKLTVRGNVVMGTQE